MSGRVRLFVACSVDGFIAGPNDELDWLMGREGAEDTFSPFLAQIGAILMGRRTYDVVTGFDDVWPYGDTPLLVATHRPLQPSRASVRPVSGTIVELVAEARETAGDRDVYLDGGTLIRTALDAELVDHATVTVVPEILGDGIPLFAGVSRRHALDLIHTRMIGAGLVQLEYRPPGREPAD